MEEQEEGKKSFKRLIYRTKNKNKILNNRDRI